MTPPAPPTLPPIFVISLARSVKRREDIVRRLDAAGFVHEIVEGIDGANPDAVRGVPHVLDDRRYLRARGRTLSGGEIGCYLSHYLLWQKIVADNIECALIFEDDARWEDDLAETVADILAAKQKWEMCLLTSDKGKCAFRNLCKVGKNRQLGYPLKRTMGLAGYLIKQQAAANLCARPPVIQEPVDVMLCRHWEWGGMRLSVRPHVVRHDEEETSMRGGKKPAADGFSGGKKIFRQIYGGLGKTGEWMRRIYYYCAVRPGE